MGTIQKGESVAVDGELTPLMMQFDVVVWQALPPPEAAESSGGGGGGGGGDADTKSVSK